LFNDFFGLWMIIEIYNLKNKNNDYQNISQIEILKSLNKFQSKENAVNFNSLGLYILENYGVKIEPKFWMSNLGNQNVESQIFPNSSLISLLEYSAKNKKIGETILLILLAMNGENFNKFHPFFLQIVITSLNQIGLEEKGFDLAIETLIER